MPGTAGPTPWGTSARRYRPESPFFAGRTGIAPVDVVVIVAVEPEARCGPEALRRLLGGRRPRDERERASLVRIAAELERLEAPFDRYADAVHVTASAIVVGRRGTVLHRHRRLGRWLQPGGHLDPGECPAQAAVREAGEETGLEVAHPAGGPCLLHVDVHPGGSGHTHLDLRYLLEATDAEPCPAPGESTEVMWLSFEEAEAMADEGLRSALAEAAVLAGHRG